MSMDEFERLKEDNNNFEKPEDRDCLEKELVAVGIFGLQDPLRPGIRESVKTCNKAKIRVIMCTGDNIDTAVAISKDAGIVTEEECAAYGGTVESGNYSCMTGKQFREMVGELRVDANGTETPENMKKFREVKK
jgi:magnesium-transporting ATPase (P-type)